MNLAEGISLAATAAAAVAAIASAFVAVSIRRASRSTRTLDVLADFHERIAPMCRSAISRLIGEPPPKPERFTCEEAQKFSSKLPADLWARDPSDRQARTEALSSLNVFALQVRNGRPDNDLARSGSGALFCELARGLYFVISRDRSDAALTSDSHWGSIVWLYGKWSRHCSHLGVSSAEDIPA